MNCKKGLVSAAILLLPVIPLHVYFSGNWYSFFHSYSFGMACGITSFVFFFYVLVLSARIKFLDRLIGQDTVLQYHGILARAAYGTAVLHIVFKFYWSFQWNLHVISGAAGFVIFFTVIIVTLMFMLNGLCSRLPGIRTLVQVLKRKYPAVFDYSNLKFFHNLTAPGFLLVAVHIRFASSTAEKTGRIYLMSGVAVLALGFYFRHTIVRRFRMRSRPLTLLSVDSAGPDCVKISLGNPAQQLPGRKPGQFAYFRFRSKQCGFEEHPFTIANAPKDEGITLYIKNLGDFSGALSRVQTGTQVYADGPYGSFTPPVEGRPQLFIAGGIGITPFISILNQRDGGMKTPVVLVWSGRSRADLFLAQYFESFAQRNSEFTFIPVCTREPPFRRIDSGFLTDVIGQNNSFYVYMCGPAVFMSACRAALLGLGISKENIFTEKFSV